ncbi:MAG TPA: hypothetical protein PK307_02005 [Spirochaetota bacterium]|nr:hypothetical protein [Spirochaetota bacterium]HOD13858.1 hypothetical protein [Spirochaetota bacterium]HPG51458.1 hypothetical protein [Spirochaetota bacterium]HPN13237.1 hypothetical protein [Spirochaetota bacterium]HQL80949.1 hypothetical protein [Spirochaetota bacterium]
MKNFILKTTVAVIIAGIAYLLFFSLVKIDAGMMCVVEDLRVKKAVAIVRPVAGDFGFVWQGALPWWFVVSEVPKNRVARFDARIVVPGFERLRERYYHLWVPLRVSYRIDTSRFTGVHLLSDRGAGADGLVEKLVERGLQRELNQYLAPVYRRDMLASQAEPALAAAVKVLEKELSDEGMVISGARLAGALSLPEMQVYNEGLAHATDLRTIDKKIETDLLDVRSVMEMDRIKNEQFYGKLKEISKIIGANPDILKYIYIDKMAANVKVILSSDNSGLPGMLEKEMKPKKGKSREIDNLR